MDFPAGSRRFRLLLFVSLYTEFQTETGECIDVGATLAVLQLEV